MKEECVSIVISQSAERGLVVHSELWFLKNNLSVCHSLCCLQIHMVKLGSHCNIFINK